MTARPVMNEPVQTLKEIDLEISKLKERAASIIASEKAGVIERINEAIAYYGLTPADLGFGAAARASSGQKPVKASSARQSRSVMVANGPDFARVAAAPAKKPRAGAGGIKYKDGAGHAWSGFGPKPRWFTEALANGKSLEDLKA